MGDVVGEHSVGELVVTWLVIQPTTLLVLYMGNSVRDIVSDSVGDVVGDVL